MLNDFKSIKSVSAVFFNNIGLVHHVIDKPSLSSLYFQRALNENAKFISKYGEDGMETSKNNKNKPTDNADKSCLNMRLLNRRNEILFNMGLSLLFSKQPVCLTVFMVL
jgi:hypothetical protein